MVGTLMDYYMGDFSPYKRPSGRSKIGDKSGGLNLSYFMDVMSQTFVTVETRGMKASGTRPPTCKPEDKDKELAWPPMKCMHLLTNKVNSLSLSLSLSLSQSTN